MKLKFKINKYYLLVHALKQSKEPFSGWINFQNRIWKKFPKGYYLYSWYSEAAFIDTGSLKDFDKSFKEAKRLVSTALHSREFKRLYKETQKYLLSIKGEWARNGKRSLKILEELSGIKLPDKTIIVLITHPKLNNGMYFPKSNIIGFGHIEEWPNYATVYFCHELMHILTDGKYKNGDVMHAIIELMTDNELRARLGKRLKSGFSVGHPYLKKLRKKIYPHWQKYLKRKKKEGIFNFEKEIIKNLKRRAAEKPRRP